jgi:uncharacterized membrane protein YccC
MGGLFKRLGKSLGSGPNRIALSTALRGTLATVVPLALLPNLGLTTLAYPAVLGALATTMVDVGGPYRTRLVAMLVQALGGPCLLLLGSATAEHWGAAAAVMAAIGILSGLIRALGPGGASLSTHTAVAFLVGVQVGEIEGGHEACWAFGYCAGGLWTIVIALAFWQLRPYRRLEQEVAGAWEAVASLLDAAASPEDKSVVARRRREQRIAAAHAAVRIAIERSRDALGEMRAGTAGPGTTVAQLVVLIDAAAGVAASAVSFCEMEESPSSPPLADDLARACRAVGRVLLAGKGELPLVWLRQRLEAVRSQRGAAQARGEILACTQAMRHLDDAEEALRMLFGVRHRLPDLLHLPFAHRLPHGAVLDALRAHATPRSAVFRHAMRVAAVTAGDTALLVYFRLPHGIWLPLTSLAILQPDYSGTATRALQRSLGTIAGAVIAGALLATVHRTVGYDLALGVLLFATFLIIRRNYGYGITFLTPIIILLIGASSADPWIDLAERIAYTVAGALLALAAAYLLWPQWERDRLRDRLGRAISAQKAYVDAVLQALSEPAMQEGHLAALRRQAEMTVANADSGFQRMLAEPVHRTPLLSVGFALLVYLHRLCRHTIALSVQLPSPPLSEQPLTRLRQLIAAVLEDLGRVVSEGRMPVPWPTIELHLAEVAAQLEPRAAAEPGAAVATLLGRLIADMRGLLSAAGYDRSGAAPSQRTLSGDARLR